RGRSFTTPWQMPCNARTIALSKRLLLPTAPSSFAIWHSSSKPTTTSDVRRCVCAELAIFDQSEGGDHAGNLIGGALRATCGGLHSRGTARFGNGPGRSGRISEPPGDDRG